MEISALLSPQESPVRDATPTVAKASPKGPRKSRASTTPKVGLSPLSKTLFPSEPSLLNGTQQTRIPIPSPPANGSPHNLAINATGTPPTEAMRLHQQSSTSGMDTLADLASMQHHQQIARVNAGGLRNMEVFDTQLVSAANLPPLHALSRNNSRSRSSFDVAMQDAPTRSPPRTFSAPSLSEAELKTVAQLVGYLAENPYAYDSHVQLVKLLHQGLIAHVHPQDSSRSPGTPQTYPLLPDLQRATEAMDARFTLGEELWGDRLHAQRLLAVTLEDCLGVIDACQKAVTEETGSTPLWLAYGEWMVTLYNMAHPHDQYPLSEDAEPRISAQWSEEDNIVAKEVFSKTQILDVWSRAVEETKFRISDSYKIWDRYTDLLMQDLHLSPTREAIVSIEKHFFDRLHVPHATWDQTSQKLSTFISTYDNPAYEEIMVLANRQCAHAKRSYEARELFEVQLLKSINNRDKATEWSIMTEYLEWERTQGRKEKTFSFDLTNALYQRALLRFSTNASLWEDYLMFLIDESEHRQHTAASLPVLDRACRHCPSSGTLWSQYLEEAEHEHRPFTDMADIKHRATSTGLLDAGGMEDVLKVHYAWCGFLRRRAFERDSTDEDMDVAEVGIRSAIEDMETLGRRKYGNEYRGDPQFRLERLYIKYLSQCRNWQGARDTWKSLISRHGDSYIFWLRYYNWEMMTWGKLSNADNALPDEVPREATNVLRQAVKRVYMDWPEKIMDTFMYHCQDHETVEDIQRALNLTRKTMKLVTRRRETEARQAAEQAQQQSRSVPETGAEVPNTSTNGKRKRDESESVHSKNSVKKSRPDIIESKEPVEEQPLSIQPALKRDRENSTVIVKNLPVNTTQTRVRQFFRDCGTINTLKLIPEQDGDSATATIEFESKEDVLAARTKDMKIFDGNSIEVQIGSGSTLYVTNFPSTADEAYIRNLFDKYGDIISVRFPSLKFNTRRRFCYVEFKVSNQAHEATELDGTAQEGDLTLSVKVSDPSNKKARTGAVYDGREVHVSNVDWSVTEDELKDVFAKYGDVERVRVPRDLGGKSKGFAFVVFSNKDEATSSLELHLTKLKSRLLHVSLSTADPAKRQALGTIRHASTSTSPAPDLHISPATGSHSSPNSHDPATISAIYTIKNTNSAPLTSLSTDIAARTISLLHIPDTVSAARLRALLAPYGTLKKLTLRPDHAGAIAEFEEEASVGKATLAVGGLEIDGRRIGVGTVRDLMRERGERKVEDKVGVGKTGVKGWGPDGKEGKGLGSGVVRRPLQGGRRGGKGGLGLKGSGGGLGGPRAGPAGAAGPESAGTQATNGVAATEANGDGEAQQDAKTNAGRHELTDTNTKAETSKAKTNADFKAMFLKS